MDFLDDDSDDELSSKPPFGGKEATIFVIDCRKSMFNIDCEKSAFILAVKATVSCSSDEIGVILFGTEKMQNSYDFKHIFVLENLKQANVEIVLFFDKTLSKFTEKEFSNKYGINENYSLAELLWLCNDNPFEADKQKRNKSISRAAEVKLNQITIDVIPMCAGFNFGYFYDDIVTIPRFGKTEDFKPEEFMNRILMKSHKQRIYAIIPINLGD
ncbi:X-ray repair cross-complementing protein 5-like protein, partial [Leptotrombidium deliense]